MAMRYGRAALPALGALALLHGPAAAQSAAGGQDTAALEARIAQLEAALVELRAEMAASRAQAPAPPPAAAPARLLGRKGDFGRVVVVVGVAGRRRR